MARPPILKTAVSSGGRGIRSGTGSGADGADLDRHLRCPLCNRDFPASTMACHAGCPISRHCRVLCCPHCGYEFPDEEAIRRRVGRLQDLSRNLMRSVFRRRR